MPARSAFGRRLLETTERIGQYFRDAYLDSETMFGMKYERVSMHERVSMPGGTWGSAGGIHYYDDPVTDMLRKDSLTVREVDAVRKETGGELTVEYLKARRTAQDRERRQAIGKRMAQFRAEEQPTKEEEAAYLKKLLRVPELRRNRMPGMIEQKEPKPEKVKYGKPSEAIDPFGIYGRREDKEK